MQKSELADKKSELFLLLVLMIATIVINHELINYNPHFFNRHLNINIFIYPFTFFLTNLITKRHGIVAGIISIFLATTFWIAYYLFESFFITGYSFQKEFLISNILVFLISQIINLIIYSKISKNNQDHIMELILTSIVVLSNDTLLKIILVYPINSFVITLPNYLISNVAAILVSIIAILTTYYISRKG